MATEGDERNPKAQELAESALREHLEKALEEVREAYVLWDGTRERWEHWVHVAQEMRQIADAALASRAPAQEKCIGGTEAMTFKTVAEWTDEYWAEALRAARDDLMMVEDFEPTDIAHVMECVAVRLVEKAVRAVPAQEKNDA